MNAKSKEIYFGRVNVSENERMNTKIFSVLCFP